MACSKCDSRWCWICEGELDEKHTKRSCLIGKNIRNSYWSAILFFLFFPVSYFFMIFFVVWYKIETNEMEIQCCLKNKFLNKLLAFIVSPIMSFIVFPLIATVFCLKYLLSVSCLEEIGSLPLQILLLLFVFSLFFIVFPASIAIYVGLGIVLSIILPVLGLVLLILKVGQNLKN